MKIANFWCSLGLHRFEQRSAVKPVEWVGGAAGARPFQEFAVKCKKCGLETTRLYRASGQGLIP